MSGVPIKVYQKEAVDLATMRSYQIPYPSPDKKFEKKTRRNFDNWLNVWFYFKFGFVDVGQGYGVFGFVSNVVLKAPAAFKKVQQTATLEKMDSHHPIF